MTLLARTRAAAAVESGARGDRRGKPGRMMTDPADRPFAGERRTEGLHLHRLASPRYRGSSPTIGCESGSA